jgi:broad specificity phosphatase PhoE
VTTTILLVRHGSHDRLDKVLCGRMAGVSLGDSGRAEAAQVGARLANTGLSAVLSSPLERAQETAAAIASVAGLTVETDPDLNELDLGDWSGRRFEDLHGDPAWDQWNRLRQHTRPPAGETMLESQVRAVRFLHRARDRFPDGTIAAVSHADIIKTALCWALGLSLESYSRFEVRPASISRLVLGDWGAHVWSINEEVGA